MAASQPRYFLSHTVQDTSIASILIRYLRTQGVDAVSDQDVVLPGAKWATAIAEALSGADGYIFLLTRVALDSQWVMRSMVFAVDAARERDKPIFLVVFDDADIDKNLSWRFYAADCLWIRVKSSNVDWFQAVGEGIVSLYSTEQEKRIRYEEFSELRKSGNDLYAADKLSDIVSLIVRELRHKCPAARRDTLLMELDRCLSTMESLYGYDYSPTARTLAHKRLEAIDQASRWLRAQPEPDLILAASAIRLLYWDREIRWQCADTLTSGDVSDGIVHTLPQAHYEQAQAPYRERYQALIASGSWEALYPEAQREFIRQAEEYLYQGMRARPPRPEIAPAEAFAVNENLEAIARFIRDSNRIFELVSEDESAADFLRCLITSYERLKNYCDAVGAKGISAECIERIALLKSRYLRCQMEQGGDGTVAQKGIKALLGLTLPGSDEYDVFLSHKSRDQDIATNVYCFLKSGLKKVFFDKVSLPEMSKSEYRRAIMTALDHSRHFVVIITDLSMLQPSEEVDWVRREMDTFHTEIFEGRKTDSNFIILATDTVFEQIVSENKNNIAIDWRHYTIFKISEYRDSILSYLHTNRVIKQ